MTRRSGFVGACFSAPFDGPSQISPSSLRADRKEKLREGDDLENKKPVPVVERADEKLNWSRDLNGSLPAKNLALGFFGDFFFLRALFLFFLLQLVVDEFEDGHLGAVTDADAGGDDARVTSRSIRELGSDVGEELLRDVRRREVRGGLAAR